MRRDHGTETLPENGPQFKIDVALLKDTVTITIDTTGRGLHRRGYRAHVTAAPLKETLAAAMVMLSYWKRDRPLVDPFCGSGTILIEAAMIGRNMAPGQSREFAFEHWPDAPRQAMLDLRSEALQNVLEPLPQRLLGGDTDFRVLRFARENAEAAGVTADVHFETADARELQSKRRFGCLITNPPYGMRIGRDWEIEDLYAAIPDVLRHLPTWSFYFLTAYNGFERILGRKADRRRKLYNGRIECTYYQFHGPKPVIGQSGRSESATDEGKPTADAEQTTGEEVPAAQKIEAPSSPEESPVATKGAKPYVHAVGEAAFGALPENAQHQAELFATRLRKRAKHFRRMMT
ncbi:THUMP domain-containing class I SAM-dependent RNA methyltransferase, partial [Rhodopirellula sallentina]